MIPVTNRYGQGRETPARIWAALLDCARRGDADLFKDKIAMRRKRCLTLAECKSLLADMGKPGTNRMQVLLEGTFTVKNMAEFMAAQKFIAWRPDELAILPDGPGADRYWTYTRQTRAVSTQQVKALFDKVETVEAAFAGEKKEIKIGINASSISEKTTPFWACAQTRILRL